jgi:hypothetical protein
MVPGAAIVSGLDKSWNCGVSITAGVAGTVDGGALTIDR